MEQRFEILPMYVRIARTYVSQAPSLLLLATIVFVPVGLIDALTIEADVGSFNASGGLEIAAVVGALLALSATALVGEVFYSGVVAISLTHAEHGRSPRPSEIGRRLNYGRLIAVDLLYGLLVAVGLVLLLAPGVVLFTVFGLSGPVVEIEDRGVRAAFARSWHLVRGRFWAVLAVLAPVEILGDSLSDLLVGFIHDQLGHSLAASWLAESLSNIVLTPVYAIAAVLLTLDLIAEKDGAAPKLHSAPTSA